MKKSYDEIILDNTKIKRTNDMLANIENKLNAFFDK